MVSHIDRDYKSPSTQYKLKPSYERHSPTGVFGTSGLRNLAEDLLKKSDGVVTKKKVFVTDTADVATIDEAEVKGMSHHMKTQILPKNESIKQMMKQHSTASLMS